MGYKRVNERAAKREKEGRPFPSSQGNALYQKAKYSAAIDAYTEAITMCPRWILPIINRALCHRKRKNWGAVREDCEKALDIDRESIKANYMLGLSLIFEKKHVEVRTGDGGNLGCESEHPPPAKKRKPTPPPYTHLTHTLTTLAPSTHLTLTRTTRVKREGVLCEGR
jgi:tetratricopeptide (TPR) repeat protein